MERDGLEKDLATYRTLRQFIERIDPEREAEERVERESKADAFRRRVVEARSDDRADVERRFAMIDVRERTIARAERGGVADAPDDRALVQHLHDRWVASGHDLAEFNSYLAEVDNAAYSYLAK